jgi:RP/EB family microtubule-associated protein
MANENIGMMEGAFFVSKNELISWVNDLLQIHITKVEQMASGAAYCQILDIMYPASIPMNKINWLAQYDHEFVGNYKILQAAFDKHRIQKHIDVEKLIKAKYQDNLEFFQWFKRFFDLNCGTAGDYNPTDRRRGAKTPWDTPDKRDTRNRSSDKKGTSPKLLSPRGPSPGLRIPTSPTQAKPVIQTEKLEKLEGEIRELKEMLLLSEKEKDFYFSKLRIIENYCDYHELKQSEYLMDIQKILFASESDKLTLGDNGSVMIG